MYNCTSTYKFFSISPTTRFFFISHSSLCIYTMCRCRERSVHINTLCSTHVAVLLGGSSSLWGSYGRETAEPGLCGLQNLENTSFMNSVLQVSSIYTSPACMYVHIYVCSCCMYIRNYDPTYVHMYIYII